MTYQRVIPRDLFNEANLLKCYGRLWILLKSHIGHGVEFDIAGPTNVPFEVRQNNDDGSLRIANVELWIGEQYIELRRPLNSRESWPLYATADDDEIAVFTGEGNLTPEFQALL